MEILIAEQDFYFGNKIFKTKKDFYLDTIFLDFKTRFLSGNKIFKLETEIFNYLSWIAFKSVMVLGNRIFKVNNRNTRTRCETFSS